MGEERKLRFPEDDRHHRHHHSSMKPFTEFQYVQYTENMTKLCHAQVEFAVA